VWVPFSRLLRRTHVVLPRRLEKFDLQVTPEKTCLLRFSRFHPSRKRRFTFLGFEFYWNKDRQGVPRVQRRTACRKLQAACHRIKEWIQANRHLPGRMFFQRLNSRLQGHYNYYGVRGNFSSLDRFYHWAIACAFKWLNRRSQRRSFSWGQFKRLLDLVNVAVPKFRVGGWLLDAFTLHRGSEYN
jgi:RNA-directed DNA polymerase